MNLTRRGWAMAATTLVATAAAVAFGIQELYPLAAAAASLLVGGAAWVGTHRIELDSARRLRPVQVGAGEVAEVELELANSSRRRSPLCSMREPFGQAGQAATFRLAPLRSGQRATSSYRLPPMPRGWYLVGPLVLSVTDPFQLMRRTKLGAPASTLTVHPDIVALSAAPNAAGSDHLGPVGRGTVTAGREEFSALRPYREGDDLRRVHWPSTARLDRVMVRQTDALTHPRCTVAVDLRSGSWTPDLLEEALAAAASVLDASRRAHIEIRLLTTPQERGAVVDTGFGASGAHWRRVLDALAMVRPGANPGISAPLATQLRSAGGAAGASADDTLTIITSARASRADLIGLGQLAPPASLIVVTFGPGDGQPEATSPGRCIRSESNGGFAEAWAEVFAPQGRLVKR